MTFWALSLVALIMVALWLFGAVAPRRRAGYLSLVAALVLLGLGVGLYFLSASRALPATYQSLALYLLSFPTMALGALGTFVALIIRFKIRPLGHFGEDYE